jgi:hypothetical protein
MNMKSDGVRASRVLGVEDLKMQAEPDVRKIVSRFVSAAEGVVGHWVEYAKGVFLFVMTPDDRRSGAFYVYDRQRRCFWLLEPADGVFGGYSISEMRRKIQAFGLLDFAENPAQLIELCQTR